MRHHAFFALLLAGQLLGAAVGASEQLPPEQEQFFETKVRPLLVANCQECHGAKKQESGLRLDSREALIEGGGSGARTVVPGDPDRSQLVKAINHVGDYHMPPKKSGKKISPQELDLLKQWIASGAKFTKHWSYEKLSRPVPPEIRNPQSAIRNPQCFSMISAGVG